MTNDDETRVKHLTKALRNMGDPRLGGSRPLGGKANAGGSGSGPDNQVRGDPKMFLTVPAAGEKAEGAAYDHEMNMMESELEDIKEKLKRKKK